MFSNLNRVITIEAQPSDVLAVTGMSDQGLAEVLKFPPSASSPTGQVSGFAALLPVVNAWLKAYDADPELKSVTDDGQRGKILAFLQGTQDSPGIIEAIATLATEGARIHLSNLVGSDVPLTVAQRVALLSPLTALHTAVNPDADATLEAILQLEEALKVQVDTTKITPPDVTDLAQALQQAQNPESTPETPTSEPKTPADDATAADAPADAPADTTADDSTNNEGDSTNNEATTPASEEPTASASAPPLPDAPAKLPTTGSATITITDVGAFFNRMLQIDQELANGVTAVMQGVSSVSAGLVEATQGMQAVINASRKKNQLFGEAFGITPADTPAIAEKAEV